jgi:hypothetical protein
VESARRGLDRVEGCGQRSGQDVMVFGPPR